MKYYFIVLKKTHPDEKTNPYSLVSEEILATIPSHTIETKKEVENKLYSKQEFETMREELLK